MITHRCLLSLSFCCRSWSCHMHRPQNWLRLRGDANQTLFKKQSFLKQTVHSEVCLNFLLKLKQIWKHFTEFKISVSQWSELNQLMTGSVNKNMFRNIISQVWMLFSWQQRASIHGSDCDLSCFCQMASSNIRYGEGVSREIGMVTKHPDLHHHTVSY